MCFRRHHVVMAQVSLNTPAAGCLRLLHLKSRATCVDYAGAVDDWQCVVLVGAAYRPTILPQHTKKIRCFHTCLQSRPTAATPQSANAYLSPLIARGDPGLMTLEMSNWIDSRCKQLLIHR